MLPIQIKTNQRCLLYRNGQPFSEWENSLAADRKAAAAQAVGSWTFSAHDLTDDELLYGALLMLRHALSMPELEQWRLTSGMSWLFQYVDVC
jgi:hypothetical protein